ncbi:MAG: zinc finger Ran-binding domain-containing protein [Acidobacteriota bacterium]|nr:zinc finger Ran-binding domain-containing protein [Acidobacteriota bacterium]
MEKKPEEINSDEWLKDLPLQAENPAFKPDELTVCHKCARQNPPTRLECLYCGAPLSVSEAQSKFLKPNLRKLEAWEKGFNLIFLPDSNNLNESGFEEIASLLKTEKVWLQKTVRSKKPLPLARVETEKEAEIIQQRLSKLRVETKIISDDDLRIEKLPRRLRAIDFWDDKLVLIFFNADEIAEINWEDLSLIVMGAIFTRKISLTEEHKKKGENKLLQTNETASDEILIDIYSQKDEIGYRIEQNGFDFSCLGAEKTLLVAENIRRLVKILAARSPKVKLVADYLQIRPYLASVWEVEERTDSKGLKREKFARFNRENITTINNSAQFTKYSRLQRHLL